MSFEPFDPSKKRCFRCKIVKEAMFFGHNKENCDKLKSWCRKCENEYMKERYNKHNEHFREQSKKRWENNKEKMTASAKKYYNKNYDELRAKAKVYYKKRYENLSESQIVEMYAQGAKRRALKRMAVPKWYDENAVKAIYKQAQKLGMAVDHIVPLKSDIVCGLHVQNNLQLLTFGENTAKLNRYWPDMPK